MTKTARLLVAAGLMLGSCGPSAPRHPESADQKEGQQASAPAVAGGEWSRIREAPLGWYRPEGIFWSNGKLLVVSGSTVQSWEPQARDWETVASTPQADECEGCGYSEIAVWTGTELLLWGGGFSYLAPDGNSHTGVAVTLDGEVTPLPEAPIPNRWWHGAVWTGKEMIVFGGGRDSYGRRDGAAYNPDTRTWRELPRAPVGGYANSLVWTGEEVITFGGIKDTPGGTQGYPTGFVSEGAAYDPEADRWRLLSESGLDARGWHSAVWTGEEMITWGGVSEPQTECYDCGYAEDAGAYDPSTDTWREIDPGPLPGRVEHTAVWSDGRMIIFGGGAPGGGLGREDGAVYDPVSDAWEVLPEAPIKGRYRHAATWSGEAMFVWGGFADSALSDGAIFDPDS